MIEPEFELDDVRCDESISAPAARWTAPLDNLEAPVFDAIDLPVTTFAESVGLTHHE